MTAAQTVAFREVSKRFGSRVVLAGQSATFEAGSVTIIRGRSGCGKSTLLNLIAGYVEPDGGDVERPAIVGYLVQEELLFSELSVRDNVRLRIAGARAELGDDIDAVDDALAALGLEAFASTPVSRLSGGERRRVEIASILAVTPGVVLLDEPTSGLDPDSREAVYAAAWQAFRGRTLIVVTHEEQVPGLSADARCLTLDGGQLT